MMKTKLDKETELICESKLYNKDAYAVLPSIPTNSADMIFTDPPYNTTNLKMDTRGFNLKDFLASFSRILKPSGWFFCFGTMEMHAEIIYSKIFTRKFEYIWIKEKPVQNFFNTMSPLTAHEIICAYRHTDLKKMTELYMDRKLLRTVGEPYKRKITKSNSEFGISQKIDYERTHENRGFREGTSLLKNYPSKPLMKHSERTAHPTQKSLELCKLICATYCPKNGLVLDPFAGSGTIPLSAKQTDRKYIGIEMNKEYYDIAYNRLNMYHKMKLI